MNYNLSDIQNLAKGVYPKACFGCRPPTMECRVDKNEYCGFQGYEPKERCVLWRDYDIFEPELLAQDLEYLTNFIDPISLNLIYKEIE